VAPPPPPKKNLKCSNEALFDIFNRQNSEKRRITTRFVYIVHVDLAKNIEKEEDMFRIIPCL
jgi:hypothetical protein